MNGKYAILMIVMTLLLVNVTPSFGVVDMQEPLIGTNAHSWEVSDWFNSKNLSLKELNGKVVLIRWWTAPACPYCHNSAPAINEFYEKYHDQGLEVIGLYHHKSSGRIDIKKVKKYSDDLGFKFPVAIDYDWRTLKHWWLDNHERGWTSVTFLIDQKGIIRHIHPGGQYIKGDENYAELKAMIEQLLSES